MPFLGHSFFFNNRLADVSNLAYDEYMKSKPKKVSTLEQIALRSTAWIGSTHSLVVHSCAFALFFVLGLVGIAWDTILLALTTIVSLEAIYLAIFIQMTVNRNTQSLEEVEVDIDEIQHDIDEIQEDVDEIQEDVDEIQEDVDEIQEDVEEISEEEKAAGEKALDQATLEKMYLDLQQLLEDIQKMKQK